MDYYSTSPPSDNERVLEGIRTLYARIEMIDKKVTRMQQVGYAILALVVVVLVVGVGRG